MVLLYLVILLFIEYKILSSDYSMSPDKPQQSCITTSSEGDNEVEAELGPACHSWKKLIKFSPMVKEKKKEGLR